MTVLSKLANHLLATHRFAAFNIFNLRAYVSENATNQRAVTKSLQRLEQAGFLLVTGKIKLPEEKVHRIVYVISQPEFESYEEWEKRPVYVERISRPKPFVLVHRMQG